MTFVVDKQDMYKKMVSILMGKRLFAFSLHSKWKNALFLYF